jgi:ATP-dependent exoDNAse (exonuclease V) beta subunit
MTIFLIILSVIIVLAAVLAYLYRQQIKDLHAKQQAKREKERQEREAEKARLEQERLQREAEERARKRRQKEAADAILQEFLQKNPYIAISDWEQVKKQILETCPFYEIDANFVPQHNREFREQQKIEHKEYFDTLFTYPLDDQQREAIVTLGENVLVVAAAGSGKTATIVAKTHYLVNKMHVDPRNILVVTYTRKAAEELQTRVGVAGVECSTFHKHAIDTIARIEGEKPTICENNTLNTIFDALIH